ncbi:helix-turn-helix domain-containing protein [Flavobacterium sp. AS60]|uniref:helix-turn-helix domain-containing protein n=1 Tax=Flavobacterium anseongense TaxID=2910677 RepID=UPI001F39C3C4|nr:helix-turn-helix transcriptional regulator [Flavobacterium sp. AS60]MCF6130601.1 helix-turn-helix domain-containing protein [Flavobacterium sp. AS60]
MKRIKRENIRSRLGLTQQDIALLLKVSRTKYSLYELGLRNLPSAAGERETEMDAYMIKPEAKAPQNLPGMENEEAKIKQLLGKRLKENDYQLQGITRKIDSVQEKLITNEKAVQLLHFLNLPEEIEKALAPKAVAMIQSRVISNYKKCKSELDVLRIELELLQVQQECLLKVLTKY